MSAIPLLPTKTAGSRPPIEPPATTTFDGSPSDDRDPMHKVLEDSVKHLLKHIEYSDPDQLSVMLTLIDLRRQNIERELRFERMLGLDTLPPLIHSLYSLEFMFEENEVIRTYKRLLDLLEDADRRVRRKMSDLNIEPPASDL